MCYDPKCQTWDSLAVPALDRVRPGPSAGLADAIVPSILSFRLEPEHELAVHAAGRIPVEADVGGGGVRVAPAALQGMVEEQSLPAGRQEQYIDRPDQEPHPERQVAPVPHAPPPR